MQAPSRWPPWDAPADALPEDGHVAASDQWWNPGWSPKVWLMVAAMIFPTLGFAIWVLIEAGGESPVDPELEALAAANAGAAVITIQGTEHTSYHFPGAVPSAAQPREDGRATLVWFTGPSCGNCETPFVHRVAANYRERLVTYEKATDRDRLDEALGITDIPAFVLLDSEGRELARLLPAAQIDEPAFVAWLEDALEQ